MTTDCGRVAERLDSRHADEPAWQEHLQSCDSCRRQLETHRLLERVLENPPTVDFPAELMDRFPAIEGIASTQRSEKRGGHPILTGYAVAATLISTWILLTIDWPEVLPTGLGVVLAIIGTILLLVATLVRLGTGYSERLQGSGAMLLHTRTRQPSRWHVNSGT